MAFKEAMRKADPVILEPIMKVSVIVPEEYMGDVIGDLNSRRGHYFSNFLVKSRCFRCQRTNTPKKVLLYGHLSYLHPHFCGNKVSNQATIYWATSPVNHAIHSFGSSS